MKYKVVGTTFCNENRPRADVLTDVFYHEPPYYKTPDIEIYKYEYQGAPAYAVCVKSKNKGVPPEQIGTLSAEDAKVFAEMENRFAFTDGFEQNKNNPLSISIYVGFANTPYETSRVKEMSSVDGLPMPLVPDDDITPIELYDYLVSAQSEIAKLASGETMNETELLSRAPAYRKSGHIKKAVMYYEAIMRTKPQTMSHYKDLANIYKKYKLPFEELRVIDRALENALTSYADYPKFKERREKLVQKLID